MENTYGNYATIMLRLLCLKFRFAIKKWKPKNNLNNQQKLSFFIYLNLSPLLKYLCMILTVLSVLYKKGNLHIHAFLLWIKTAPLGSS